MREEVDHQPALGLKRRDRVRLVDQPAPDADADRKRQRVRHVFAQRAHGGLQVGLAGAAQLVGDHAAAAGQLEQAVAGQALEARAIAAPPHPIATGSATMVDTAGARASAPGRISTVAPQAGSASKTHHHFIALIIDAPRTPL